MKQRREIDRLLLLRDSGELDDHKRLRIEREIASNPEVARISSEMENIKGLVRVPDEEAVVSEATIDAVLRAARKHHNQRRSGVAGDSFSWRPAIYSAAAALLLLSASLLIWQKLALNDTASDYAMLSLNWNSELDDQLSELDQIVTSTLLEYSDEIDAQRDLNSLARELINLEEAQI